MRKYNLLLFSILFILLASVFLVSGFQGTSDSYTSDNRPDTFSEGDASSISFTQRLIGGIQSVGQYITDSFTGRFGILTGGQNLVINITSHQDNDIVIRGNDVVSGEDNKGYVPNSFNLTARVFDSSTNTGFQGANCFFYDSSSFFGNATTNSSGSCTMNFTQTSLGVGIRNFLVNYSITTSDIISQKNDTVNVSINRYITDLTLGNKRNSGCGGGGSCYHHGDIASLDINISKINETATFQYDPRNISANATNAAETVYPNGDFYYPGDSITRTAVGEFNTSIEVNAAFGRDIRWDALVSDNNFTDFLSTTVHSDIEICEADWGAFGGWSACNGEGRQTRTRTDSTGCSDVEFQSCTVPCVGPQCDTGESCFTAGTKILMADGTSKNIEDVKVGDEIESYDLVSGELTSAKVLELESPLREGYYSINNKVNVTNEHPFYVLRKNNEYAWAAVIEEAAEKDIGSNKLNGLEIYELEIGDKFFTSNSEWEEVETIEYYEGEVQTYNLKSVDNYNVFFANDFLVHNKGCTAGTWSDWGEWSECIDDQETRTRTDGCNTETEFRPCGCVPLIACDDDWSQCTASQQLSFSNDFEQPIFEYIVLEEKPVFKIEKISEGNFVNLELEKNLITGSVVEDLYFNIRDFFNDFFNSITGNSITGNSITGMAVITSSCESGDDLGNTQCHSRKNIQYQECISKGKGRRINYNWKTFNCAKGLVCGGEGECLDPLENPEVLQGVCELEDKQCHPRKDNKYQECITRTKKNIMSLIWKNKNCARGLVCGGEGECVPPSSCTLTSATWSETNAIEGDQVTLTVSGDNCEKQKVTFEIFDKDLIGSNPVSKKPPKFTISDGQASTTWVAEYQEDIFGDPEYFFIATIVKDHSVSLESGLMSVEKLFVPPTCGDEIVEAPETCDDGINNGQPAKCNLDCTGITPGICGNNILEEGEICDGNSKECVDEQSYAGIENCFSNCTGFESCVSEGFCGDRIVNGNEFCDDGNVLDNDGCSAICEVEAIVDAVCGNNVTELPETCDDGNLIDGDGCNSVCELEIVAVCGNYIAEGNEECDDGNLIDGDGCSSSCIIEDDGGFDDSDGLGEGQVLLALGETIEVTINKGDRLSITYEEKRDDLVLVKIIRLVTDVSIEQEEIHRISIDSIDNGKITVTVLSDPITKDISLGSTETFEFVGISGSGRDDEDTGTGGTGGGSGGGGSGGGTTSNGEGNPEFSPPDFTEIPGSIDETINCWFLEVDFKCSPLSLDSSKTCKEHSSDYYSSEQECEETNKTKGIISVFLDLGTGKIILIVIGAGILLKIILRLLRKKKHSGKKSKVIKLLVLGGVLLLVFGFLTFNESLDINSSLTGKVVNENLINEQNTDFVFIPLATGNVEGTQTKLCRDLNKCKTDESWVKNNTCIISTGENYIRFTPTNRNLLIADKTRIDFVGEISQNPSDLIRVDWYLNNEFQKGDSLSGELTSEFSRVFSVNSVVKAELSINSQTQVELWEIKINPDVIDCEEDWDCDYTPCDGFFKDRIDETCIDNNACGTNLLFPLAQESCDCVPEYECDDWSECLVDYSLSDILKGDPTIDNEQYRNCYEINGCMNEKQIITKEQECNLGTPVEIEVIEWCFEDYVAITEVESGNLVSRIKSITTNNILSLNIGFITTEFEGVCGYCFDGIKNYDETGVDCGGSSCPRCVLLSPDSFFDYMLYIKVTLWILLALLALCSMYQNRSRMLGFSDGFKQLISKRIISRIRRPKLHELSKLSVTGFGKPKVVLPKVTMPRVDIRISVGGKRREERKHKRAVKRVERKRKREERKVERKKRKVVRNVRRKHKKAVRHEVRVIKRKIRKKQVSRSETADMRKKLKEWRAQGFGNAKLEKKLDKLEGKKK